MIEHCQPSLLSSGDASIAWIATHIRQPWLDPLMIGITQLGKVEVIILICALLYWFWNKRYSKYLAYGILATAFLNISLKNIVMECRPATEFWLDTANGYSFPSGHAQYGIVLWWGLAYYVQSRALSIFYVLLGILIALSRLYLGVHYPLDVIVGSLLGFATYRTIGWFGSPSPLGRRGPKGG